MPRRPIYEQVLGVDFKLTFDIQTDSSDFDTEHPTLIHLGKVQGLSAEERLWLTICYMAFYNEASAYHVLVNNDPWTMPKNVTTYPLAKNRRNLYGGRIVKHFLSILEHHKNDPDWPRSGFGPDPKHNWQLLKQQLSSVWGNGRFGTYTTAEMLHKVNNFDVVVTDADNRGSTGPVDGLRRLYNYWGTNPNVVDHLVGVCYNTSLEWEPHVTYTDYDLGVLESILCNFSGICRGVFYPGRNIDRQQDRLIALEKIHPGSMKELWECRPKVFPKEYLGEYNTWTGVNNARMKHYKRTKEILWPNENR